MGDDRLEDFVPDRGKDTLVVVQTERLQSGCLVLPYSLSAEGRKPYLVDLRQCLDIRPVQNPQRQTDHLQVLGARGGRDISGLGADVVDDGLLQPRDEEVGSLINHLHSLSALHSFIHSIPLST